MEISYNKLVHQPEQILPAIADFLGCSEKLCVMKSVINPDLHRVRNVMA
jgi:hypothetical protein